VKSAYFCIFYRFFGSLRQEKNKKKSLVKKKFSPRPRFEKKQGALGYTVKKKEIVVGLTQDTIFVRIEDSFRTFGPHRKNQSRRESLL